MVSSELRNIFLPEGSECLEIEGYVEYASSNPPLTDDEELLRRFCLVGLFPTYRSCNHMGIDLDTNDWKYFESPHSERLRVYDETYGRVLCTEDCLKSIRFSGLRLIIPWFSLSAHLIYFVYKKRVRIK